MQESIEKRNGEKQGNRGKAKEVKDENDGKIQEIAVMRRGAGSFHINEYGSN